MESQIISGFGGAIWCLALVVCAGVTVFCTLLLGAIQLERVKGGPVHPHSFDWSFYLVLAIFAGLGLTTLLFLDMPTAI